MSVPQKVGGAGLSLMTGWKVERIITFERGDLCKDGFVHFGFHGKGGRQYALEHQKHFLGLVGEENKLKWTAARRVVFEGVPNIRADIKYPMYVDSMPDGTLIQSNFGNNHFFRIDVSAMEARLFLDGNALGMKGAGNCIVDDEGCVWVNEVEGCRVWRFDSTAKPILTLGNGKPGFQYEDTDFEHVRFNWIYDIRKGPDGNIYVLDSRNFAVRMIDVRRMRVFTLAGVGKAGYQGDGGDARFATFGSDSNAKFDGPISLSIDEECNIFVGDRFNHVVRMIERRTGIIRTIAGNHSIVDDKRNDPEQSDPFKLNLPKISSLDYYGGRLFIPTDLTDDLGDLIVLRKT